MLLLALLALLALNVSDAAAQTEKPISASQPASQPASAPAGGLSPEQANVLKDLLRAVDRPAMTAPEPIRSSAPSPAARRDESLQGEGTVIVERVGRLIRSSERSEFKFSSPDSAALTQPLELLPNSWLEFMEKEAEAGASEFIITADVTRYRGRNFLLIRSYRRQVSHGNLSP